MIGSTEPDDGEMIFMDLCMKLHDIYSRIENIRENEELLNKFKEEVENLEKTISVDVEDDTGEIEGYREEEDLIEFIVRFPKNDEPWKILKWKLKKDENCGGVMKFFVKAIRNLVKRNELYQFLANMSDTLGYNLALLGFTDDLSEALIMQKNPVEVMKISAEKIPSIIPHSKVFVIQVEDGKRYMIADKDKVREVEGESMPPMLLDLFKKIRIRTLDPASPYSQHLEEFFELEKGKHHFLILPMVGEKELLGFLVLARKGREFSNDDLRFARRIAIRTMLILDKVLLLRKLRERAIKDPLTSVYNRRYFVESVKQLMAQSRRKMSKITFLMVDINNFKSINDKFGHLEGDRVLKEVAMRLAELVREEDMVVRYGGDEFLVVLADVGDENTIKRIASRISNGVSKFVKVKDEPVTLSIGWSVWNPSEMEKLEDVLRKADGMMYEMKLRKGR